MALSQKHVGKVLTPWFNLYEWQTTKQLIYSNSEESKKKALSVLKLWKLRTPLLSIGVEGTLILLEALLESFKDLTDYELAQIYSTALLRFLNICAASNERQGTFYKTAEKNDLPYWLVTLRHDIAHDHKIPSKTILECALNECFKWIQEKYWDVQDLYMKDYVVSDSTNFKEIASYYVKLNLHWFYNQSTGKILEEIKTKFQHVIPALQENEADVINYIELLDNFFIEYSMSTNKDAFKDLVSALVDTKGILFVQQQNVEGVKRIPLEFLNLWMKIINALYEKGQLVLLLEKLVDVSGSESFDESMREIASLWIAELYRGLLQSDEETIFFGDGYLPIEESCLLESKIEKNPNNFTLNFLDLVMKFNGQPMNITKEKCKRVKKLVRFDEQFFTEADAIHSMEELQELFNEELYSLLDKKLSEIESKEVISKKKFRKLTDAEKLGFKGYPLGLLPPKT